MRHILTTCAFTNAPDAATGKITQVSFNWMFAPGELGQRLVETHTNG